MAIFRNDKLNIQTRLLASIQISGNQMNKKYFVLHIVLYWTFQIYFTVSKRIRKKSNFYTTVKLDTRDKIIARFQGKNYVKFAKSLGHALTRTSYVSQYCFSFELSTRHVTILFRIFCFPHNHTRRLVSLTAGGTQYHVQRQFTFVSHIQIFKPVYRIRITVSMLVTPT